MMTEQHNDFNAVSSAYRLSDHKPDKLYSILPTVLYTLGNVRGKTVLDLGCGSGFFSRAFIEAGAKKVIGIDSSVVQIRKAHDGVKGDVEFYLQDVFTGDFPENVDVINAPFIVNYLTSEAELMAFLQRCQRALRPQGEVVFVIDLPSEKDLTRFGARKIVSGPLVDWQKMIIELYTKSGASICTLYGNYISPLTFERCLKEVGFLYFRVPPIVTQKGYDSCGEMYWEEYLKDTQLGYYICL